MAAKLRFLKAGIKEWHDSNFAKENGELIKCRSKLAQIDLNVESGSLLGHEIGNRTKYSHGYEQKAKVKYLVDGDENTSFFHGYVNNQNRRKHIHGLMINGHWDLNPASIRNEVFCFFSLKFEEK
uniref:Uncharacterized protein n=1 Tax=Lactuca sativa TaxID=4236 RepID=A0A9R1XKE9_LACSA|nr:hypothetical protein LSAT_V11C300139170 [Lactuca sativa]